MCWHNLVTVLIFKIELQHNIFKNLHDFTLSSNFPWYFPHLHSFYFYLLTDAAVIWLVLLMMSILPFESSWWFIGYYLSTEHGFCGIPLKPVFHTSKVTHHFKIILSNSTKHLTWILSHLFDALMIISTLEFLYYHYLTKICSCSVEYPLILHLKEFTFWEWCCKLLSFSNLVTTLMYFIILVDFLRKKIFLFL